MNTTDNQLDKTWEFKGIEIPALSIGRKNNLITLISCIPAGPTMFASALYGATCKTSIIIKALRDPDSYFERVTEWMEEIQLDQQDFEQLGTIFKELFEHTNANRAVPVTDPNMMPDPLGNV